MCVKIWPRSWRIRDTSSSESRRFAKSATYRTSFSDKFKQWLSCARVYITSLAQDPECSRLHPESRRSHAPERAAAGAAESRCEIPGLRSCPAGNFAKAFENLPAEQMELFLPDSVFHFHNQGRPYQFHANGMGGDGLANGLGPDGSRKVVVGENPLRKLVDF